VVVRPLPTTTTTNQQLGRPVHHRGVRARAEPLMPAVSTRRGLRGGSCGDHRTVMAAITVRSSGGIRRGRRGWICRRIRFRQRSLSAAMAQLRGPHQTD
jgi:hypothetical protein